MRGREGTAFFRTGADGVFFLVFLALGAAFFIGALFTDFLTGGGTSSAETFPLAQAGPQPAKAPNKKARRAKNLTLPREYPPMAILNSSAPSP